MYDLVNGGARGVTGPTIAEENYGGSMTNFTGIYQSKIHSSAIWKENYVY